MDYANSGPDLPPLPRPLVPTLSRSFSSSSSSSSAASEADDSSTHSRSTSERSKRHGHLEPRRYSQQESGLDQLAVGEMNALDGTSPPLGMLADDQPFSDAFAGSSKPSSASSTSRNSFVSAPTGGSEGTGTEGAATSRAHSRAAISAADLDFPRSSLSPSPSLSRGVTQRDATSPTSRSFLARVSPSLTSASPSRFASTSAVGLRASPSPAPSARSATLSVSPPLVSPRTSIDERFAVGEDSSSSAASTGSREQSRPSRGAQDGYGEESSVGARRSEDGRASRGYEPRSAGDESSAPLDETLLRRRKYRARVSASAASTSDRPPSGNSSADLGVRSRLILNEINSRDGAGEGVDGVLRRMTTTETLREDREMRAPAVDEFGAVSNVQGSSFPRSRTTSDLLSDAGSTDHNERNLARSASTSTRTYGYRSGSRASQTLSSVRPSTTLSQYDSPSTTRSRIRSDDLDLHPLPASASYTRLRDQERASTARGSTADRRRTYELPASGERVRTSSDAASVSGGRRRAGLTRDLFDSPTTDRRTGTRERSSTDEYRTGPLSAERRAATALGSVTRSLRDLDLSLQSPERTSHGRDVYAVATPSRRGSLSRRSAAAVETPRSSSSAARRQWTRSELAGSATGGSDELDLELERTPRSGKKTSAESGTFSAGSDRARRLLYSATGLDDSAPPSRPLTSLSAARSVRRERSATNSEIGSEAWLAELDRRRRNNRSRMSAGGGSDDAASVVTTRTQADVDRERTVRAINDLLRDQGIVAAVASDALSAVGPSSSNASPRKRQSLNGFGQGVTPSSSLHGLVSSRNDADVAGYNGSAGSVQNELSRSGSTLSHVNGGRAETAMRGLIERASADTAEHHRLLIAALDRFDKHFSEYAAAEVAVANAMSSPTVGQPLALDLVKRMDGLVTSTTRLNAGIQGLLEAVKADQVQAQLAETDEPSLATLSHFERSVTALLRTSEEQVRCLTEDLVAIVRFDRERASITTERPASRASAYRSPLGTALQSPPRRAATASPHAGSTVSHASVRSPVTVRQSLRDPLHEQTPSPTSSVHSFTSRHTVGHANGGMASRSPLANADAGQTPSPADRRHSAQVRSPLSAGAVSYETPSRSSSVRERSTTGGMVSSESYSGRNGLAGLGLPLPPAGGDQDRPSTRGAKLSDTTVRPPSPSQARFAGPTPPVTSVDITQATMQTSPTHRPVEFSAASSPTDRALPNLPDPSPVVNTLHRFPTSGDLGWQHPVSSASVAPLPVESPTATRKRSIRLSSGFGAALKNAFSGNRKSASEGAANAQPVVHNPAKPVPPVPPMPSMPTSASMASLERTSSRASVTSVRTTGDRSERRREVEDILRRAGQT